MCRFPQLGSSFLRFWGSLHSLRWSNSPKLLTLSSTRILLRKTSMQPFNQRARARLTKNSACRGRFCTRAMCRCKDSGNSRPKAWQAKKDRGRCEVPRPGKQGSVRVFLFAAQQTASMSSHSQQPDLTYESVFLLSDYTTRLSGLRPEKKRKNALASVRWLRHLLVENQMCILKNLDLNVKITKNEC